MNLFKISAVVLVALTLASCANTIRGVGRDVNQSVDAVQDSVE
ncbi:entericidin A/B family lipoprotein [Hoeflea sp. BAL378]|nr:entericidin A/B family lipoprotein [Hoeflea sp. BAL378]